MGWPGTWLSLSPGGISRRLSGTRIRFIDSGILMSNCWRGGEAVVSCFSSPLVAQTAANPFGVQLSISFGDTFAEFVLLILGQFVDVDAVQKAFGYDILHQLCLTKTVASTGSTL